jgi:hypothetical protein
MRRLGLLAVLSSAGFPTVAIAQNPLPPQSLDVAQISRRTAALSMERISPPGIDRSLEAQLPSKERPRLAPDQLTSPKQNAEPPQAISHVEQGRTATLERVEGHDRCDPAAVERSNQKIKCQHVIESRAEEFAAPAPQLLSPEQVLLIDTQYGVGASDVVAAARRLATTGKAGPSLDSQGVASITLQPTSAPPQDGHKPPADPGGSNATQKMIPQPASTSALSHRMV